MFSHNISECNMIVCLLGEKGRDLTQSYDESPYTNRKLNSQLTTQKRRQKFRLHNDCGPT